MNPDSGKPPLETLGQQKKTQEFQFRTGVPRSSSQDTADMTSVTSKESSSIGFESTGVSIGSNGLPKAPSRESDRLTTPAEKAESRECAFLDSSPNSYDSNPLPDVPVDRFDSHRMDLSDVNQAGKGKSLMHDLFFNATDAWLNSQSSGSSGKPSPPKEEPTYGLAAERPPSRSVEQIISVDSLPEEPYEDDHFWTPTSHQAAGPMKKNSVDDDMEGCESDEEPGEETTGQDGLGNRMEELDVLDAALSVNQRSAVAQDSPVVVSASFDSHETMISTEKPPEVDPIKSVIPPLNSSEAFISSSAVDADASYTTPLKEDSTPSKPMTRSIGSMGSFDSLGTSESKDSIHSIDLRKHFDMVKKNNQASWAMQSSSSSSCSSVEDFIDVYVHDKTYAWVPAKVLEYRNDYALVAVMLPGEWDGSTMLNDKEESRRLSANIHPSMKGMPEDDILGYAAEYQIPQSILRKVRYKDYIDGQLPKQNLDGQGKRDMADLINLHSAAILYNLKERHYMQKPYTRVGDIVVAMNPCTWIDDLYSTKTQDLYAKNLIWEAHQEEEIKATDIFQQKNRYDQLGFDPHVYEVSCLAYRGLAIDGQNQTILVTGESGAGKTETVKIVMNHLAIVEQTRPEGVPATHQAAGEIVSRVCKSSPVFEAFGNAKTKRNDNSSRFGKFIQLQFEVEPTIVARQGERYVPYTDLVGSNCVAYLLEKNRVVSHAQGERTYHVFYQLLAAPSEFKQELWPSFADRTSQDFRYTAGEKVSNSEDSELWNETKEALKIFQFEGESLLSLMRALGIVLQLGNLVFNHDPSAFEEHNTVITSRDDLNLLSSMIGIGSLQLEATMTSRQLKTPGSEEIKVKLSPQAAKEACDALSKEIYSKIFGLMVRKINEYTTCPRRQIPFGYISLLDIFGFECFDVNQFEQLCINYANEQLHNKYVLDNFNQVKDEYEMEGIDLYDFALVDNSAILDLLEGRNGLIASLNEECVRPSGNAENFVYKAKIVHLMSKCLVDKKLHRKCEFGINHFAGPVHYDAECFVERNMDKLPDGLVECAAKSTNSLIRVEFEELLSSRGKEQDDRQSKKKKKRANKTVLYTFQQQLRNLMSAMQGTRTRYIRCIKPNNLMMPRLTDHKNTMHQLECSGLLTAIAISRESFPNKLPYEFILDRYACLMRKTDFENVGDLELKEKVNHVLSKWLKPLSKKNRDGTRRMPFACGKTKVYFKAGAQERLETLRTDYFEKKVIVIQAWGRKAIAIDKLNRIRWSIGMLQRVGRMIIEKTKFQRKKKAATLLSVWVRGIRADRLLQSLRRDRATIKIQSHCRGRHMARIFQTARKSAVLIQRAVRNYRKRAAFSAKLTTLVEEARVDMHPMGLRDQVKAEKDEGSLKPETSFSDIEDMFAYLRGEIVSLQEKNDELTGKLKRTETGQRDLTSKAESSLTSFRSRTQDLTKANDVLVKEVFKYKHDAISLRRTHQAKTIQLSAKLEAAELELESVSAAQESEIKALKKSMKETHKLFDGEKQSQNNEHNLLKEKHTSKVRRLKDGRRQTQQAHHDYLTRLMEVLETTHAMREKETARISAELNAVKEEKDSQIIALQKQVEILRSKNQQSSKKLACVAPPIVSVTSTRKQLETNSSGRRELRSGEFDETVQKVKNLITSGDFMCPRVDETGVIDVSAQQDTAEKITGMINFLGQLYNEEETSQGNADFATCELMEQYVAATEPQEAVGGLQQRLSKMELKMAKLMEELREKEHCKRCAIREAAARRLTHGS